MALFESNVLGLSQIGNTISATVLSPQGEGFQLLSQESKILEKEEEAAAFLKAVQVKTGLREVQMALPVQEAYHAFVTAPADMDEEGLNSLVEDQLERIFPVPASELLTTSAAFKNVLPTGELLVFVAAYSRKSLESKKALLESAGFQEPVFVLQPWVDLAAYEPLSNDIQKWVLVEKLPDGFLIATFFYGVLVETLKTSNLERDLPLLLEAYEEKVMTPVSHAVFVESVVELGKKLLPQEISMQVLKAKWDFSLQSEQDLALLESRAVATLNLELKKDYYFLSKLI